jgi:asparagine synthetase B (glutamine-hydrolysing)
MFLFVSDSAVLRPGRMTGRTRRFGELSVVRNGRAALVLTVDDFIVVEQQGNCLRVLLRRPGLDHGPVVAFDWNLATGMISCRREWSGELVAWHRTTGPPQYITSHLKLAAWLLRDFDYQWKRIEPGHTLSFTAGEMTVLQPSFPGNALPLPGRGYDGDYENLTRRVRESILQSVRLHPDKVCLLLSGGLDSSILAYCATVTGKQVVAYTFALSGAAGVSQSDLSAARKVAAEFEIPLVGIQLDPTKLVADIPLGIYLAESFRGTIVDDTPLLIAAARALREAGAASVWMGEGADDLFGGFKFALKYYKGAELAEYYRRQLRFDLPNELAIIQNVFAAWGISVAQPFWTRRLREIGLQLPLDRRVDPQRNMKQVLRDAFAGELPQWIAQRPKVATRDGTGARQILASHYGTSPNRYRTMFRRVLEGRSRWRDERLWMRKNSSD